MSEGKRTGPTDAYEETMTGDGQVIHRAKMASRALAIAMVLCTIGFGAASIAYALGWGANVSFLAKLLTFALTPLFPFTLLTRTVVRTLVTTKEVRIQQGLWGPRIPIESITRCEVLTPAQIRKERGFELYSPGSFEQIVAIGWTDETGKARKVIVGSDDPPALAAAIQQARSSGARIEAAANEAAADAEAEAEAEAEAILRDESGAP
jgi:hypothetical protein